MSRRWPWLLLALACVLQWTLPASLALRSERALRSGHRYYLHTAPVDPADPFRGRYVALSFPDARVALSAGFAAAPGTRVYLPLRIGADRYAYFGAPAARPPAAGDYLAARVQSVTGGEALLRLPFDRYYLEEHAAPAAERAYRDAGRAADRRTYVSIRVRGSDAVLEELFIDDRAVRELR